MQKSEHKFSKSFAYMTPTATAKRSVTLCYVIQVSQAMKATYVCGLKGKQNLQNLNNLTSSSNKVDEFV